MGSNHDNQSIRRRRTGAALTIAGLLLATACAGGDDDAGEPAAAEEVGDSSFGEDGGGDEAVEASQDRPAEAAGATANAVDQFDIGAIGRDVIIEMRVVLSSDNIEHTVASVMAAASTLGGGLASSDVDYGDAEGTDRGYAVLVVKVPPGQVDRLLDGLDDTATVQSINQSAQDVTEQLVDLDVRIANARRSVENVRGFMDSTSDLGELVALEAELTRRQTELEQLEAQERNLADRVALSTITIEVLPTAAIPEVAEADDDTIGDALRAGWRAFGTVLFGILFVVAATLPFIITGAVIGLLVWLVVRRRTNPSANRQAPPRPGEVPPTTTPVEAVDTTDDHAPVG